MILFSKGHVYLFYFVTNNLDIYFLFTYIKITDAIYHVVFLQKT